MSALPKRPNGREICGADGTGPAPPKAPAQPKKSAPAPAAGCPQEAAGGDAPNAAGFCGKTPRAALRLAAGYLAAAGCPDPDVDARELLRLVLRADPRLAEAPLTGKEAARLAALCQKRQTRYPLQYLVGRWPFLDFTLAVGPGVLIPRADTEIVCLAAAECVRDIPEPAVLDLCAGSGALALGLKRLAPKARVTALEKSPEALCYLAQNAREALAGLLDDSARGKTDGGGAFNTASQNAAQRAGPEGQPPCPPAPGQNAAVTVAEGDVFCYQNTLAPASLDLILSNPPYLTGDEMQTLQPELCCEPAMALFGGADGLRFYRHIAAAYRFALRPGGALVLEVGWQQAEAVAGLLRQNGWQNIETRRDLGGSLRAVLARAPAL